MKWMRCNNCYSRAAHAKEPFSLTKCGHVYCSSCISKAERQCPICNTVNVPTVQLREPLDSNISSYFTPLHNQLEQILAVSNFQEGQIRVAMERFNELDEKYEYCKDVCRKLEMAAVKIHKKFKHDKEEYLKKIFDLENENIQLKVALDRAQNSPFSNLRSNQSSASSSLNSHSCDKRFQKAEPKVSFSTPLSTDSTGLSSTSSNLGRKYFQTLGASNGTFQIPNMRKVPRPVRNRSSASTMSSITPEHLLLESLMISRS